MTGSPAVYRALGHTAPAAPGDTGRDEAGVDRRFPRLARGKGSLQRTVVAAAAVVLALAALGFLIWALVTGSAIRLE